MCFDMGFAFPFGTVDWAPSAWDGHSYSRSSSGCGLPEALLG